MEDFCRLRIRFRKIPKATQSSLDEVIPRVGPKKSNLKMAAKKFVTKKGNRFKKIQVKENSKRKRFKIQFERQSFFKCHTVQSIKQG